MNGCADARRHFAQACDRRFHRHTITGMHGDKDARHRAMKKGEICHER